MTVLPESDLQTTHVADHLAHHARVHGPINRLLSSALRGDMLSVDSVDLPGVNQVRRRSFMELSANQVVTVTHTTPGVVTLPVLPATRVVVVEASASITGWDAVGVNNHGAMCRLRVIVKAVTSINCSLTIGAAQTVNPPAGSFTAGSVHSFQWISFGTGGTISAAGDLMGFGAGVTGGANQATVEFTNLNDSGTGSFREALEAGGDRIIKPAAGLSGDINLTTRLEVQQHDNVTIDMDGRCRVLGRWLRFQDCDNLLITKTKFGPVDDGGQGDSVSFESASGATRDLYFAITQCEFEGPNSDAALDVVWNYGNDIYGTVANCLLYKHWKTCLIDADSGPPNEGGTYYMSFYENWWYDNMDRQPYSQNANTHVWNSVVDNYGEAGGGGGAIKTRNTGSTLVEYCVGKPRDIGEVVGYDGTTVTNAHDAFSEPFFGQEATAHHHNVGNVLLPSDDGQSQATELFSTDSANQIFAVPYAYSMDTTPDPEAIRQAAGLGTDPRPSSTGGTSAGGGGSTSTTNQITGRTVTSGGGASANNTADLYLSNNGSFGAWQAYTLTDANGDWTYDNLADGAYFVRVIAGGGGTWAETGASTWDSTEITVSGGQTVDTGTLTRQT